MGCRRVHSTQILPLLSPFWKGQGTSFSFTHTTKNTPYNHICLRISCSLNTNEGYVSIEVELQRDNLKVNKIMLVPDSLLFITTFPQDFCEVFVKWLTLFIRLQLKYLVKMV